MIVVHHLVIGRSVFTVWLLEELGLEVELQIYERLETGRAPKELRRVHPLGKSPVIVDEGMVIAESTAIATYLLELHDPEHRLHPRREDREEWVRFLQWLHYPEGSAFTPLMMVLLRKTSGQSLGSLADTFTDGEVELHLGYIRDSLGDRPFILGDRFSAADVGLGYIVSLAERLELLGDHPTLVEYVERLRARPAFQRAWQRTGG